MRDIRHYENGRLRVLIAVIGFSATLTATVSAQQERSGRPAASLERQKVCADAARPFMADWPPTPAGNRVEHTSHFSPSREACIVTVSVWLFYGNSGQFNEHIYDAIGGQRIAVLATNAAGTSIVWFGEANESGYIVSKPASAEAIAKFTELAGR